MTCIGIGSRRSVSVPVLHTLGWPAWVNANSTERQQRVLGESRQLQDGTPGARHRSWKPMGVPLLLASRLHLAGTSLPLSYTTQRQLFHRPRLGTARSEASLVKARGAGPATSQSSICLRNGVSESNASVHASRADPRLILMSLCPASAPNAVRSRNAYRRRGSQGGSRPTQRPEPQNRAGPATR